MSTPSPASNEASAVNPQPHPSPNPLYLSKIKSVSQGEIPDMIMNMPVTPELLKDYEGHERFLKERAKHSEQCYKAYDALRLCLIQRVDTVTCSRVLEAYRPCAAELSKGTVARMMQSPQEQAKIQAAKERVLGASAAKGTASS
jgi:hypothetical protein